MKPPFFRSSVLTVCLAAMTFCLAVMAFCLPALAQAATLTVPAQYTTIQAAINAAASGDTVLVAAGTYSGPGNRDIDFSGKSLVVTSQAGPSSTIIDCGGYKTTDGSGVHRGFYLHSGEISATISGFTVKNGYETYVSGIQDSGYGGSIFNYNPSGGKLTLTNCIVSGNISAYGGGGGIYNYNGGTTTLTNCTVSGNISTYGGNGSSGGGIINVNSSGSTLTLTNCTISGNTANNGYGGGIYNANYGSGTTILTLTNCTVSGNTAYNGGGIYNYNVGGTTTLTNCTVSGNTARAYGGGIYNENYGGNGFSTITLTNSILYGDTGGEVVNGTGTASILFSDIQGGYPGTSNIDKDPLFVNASSGDLHLKPGSPCLGTGTPDGAPPTDLDGTPRPNPPSMGAYELGAQPATITGFTLTPNQINAPGPKVTADVSVTGTFSKVYVSCALLGLIGPPPVFNLAQTGTHWTASFPTYFLKLAGANPVTFTATGTRNDGTKTTQTTTLSIKAAQPTFNLYLSPLVETVSPDQLVNFRVVVSNTSQTPAFLTDIKVILPDNMNFVSSQNFVYDGSKTLDANPSLLALPSVGKALGSNLSILSFIARVKSAAPQGSTLIVKSQVSSTGFQTAEVDAGLTVGNGTLPTAIRVDASGGLGIFNGDSSVDPTKGNTPLHGTITPKATMQNWVPILGDTRPLTLWLEVLSINSTNGTHYSVTNNKISQLLDQQRLVNPSANLSYDASFNSIGDSVSITTAFGPKAALCTLTDALIQILFVAKGKPVPTLDQVISFVQDPLLSTPFTKAAKEFTTAKPKTFVDFTKTTVDAVNDLSDIYLFPSQQVILSGLIKKHFNATISVAEVQNAIGVLKSVDTLTHFFYDLIAYNVMTKGDPMTVRFTGSTAQNN